MPLKPPQKDLMIDTSKNQLKAVLRAKITARQNYLRLEIRENCQNKAKFSQEKINESKNH